MEEKTNLKNGLLAISEQQNKKGDKYGTNKNGKERKEKKEVGDERHLSNKWLAASPSGVDATRQTHNRRENV